MILRFKGYWLKLDRSKWKNKTVKEKWNCIREYLCGQTEYVIKSIKDYWVGYVDVRTKDILIGEYSSDEFGHNELYEVSIICGRFGDGQCFSHIGKDITEEIVNNWEFSEKKKFELHLDLNAGVYQRYTFSRKQKDMLIKQLKPLLDVKWYEDNKE